MHSFLAFIENGALSTFVRETPTVLVFPAILTLHTIGMGVLAGGSIAILNIVTGIVFFFGYPEQYAYNNAFYFKAAFMGIAAFNILAFYGTSAFRQVKMLGPNADVPGRIKLIAATSLSMWIGVLVCGRLLTFFRPPFFHSG